MCYVYDANSVYYGVYVCSLPFKLPTKNLQSTQNEKSQLLAHNSFDCIYAQVHIKNIKHLVLSLVFSFAEIVPFTPPPVFFFVFLIKLFYIPVIVAVSTFVCMLLCVCISYTQTQSKEALLCIVYVRLICMNYTIFSV